tara:strand:- start:622 stop:1596 length:975 start_codon:yes stop_codon:yes gene_type:complete
MFNFRVNNSNTNNINTNNSNKNGLSSYLNNYINELIQSSYSKKLSELSNSNVLTIFNHFDKNTNNSITLSNEFIQQLYITYQNELKVIRNRNKLKIIWLMLYNKQGDCFQFEDVEAELTVLFLLHIKPKNVIEFSPFCGYSTSIILDSLSINNNNAHLKSFDINDMCSPFINYLNYSKANWNFELGDVTDKFASWNLNDIDYLFIDSDHSREFAVKYINDLLKPLLQLCRENKKRLLVSVHDVFHGRINEPYDEGEEVINFLRQNNISFYSPSRFYNQENWNIINNVKRKLGIEELVKSTIHNRYNEPTGNKPQANSIIFFVLE